MALFFAQDRRRVHLLLGLLLLSTAAVVWQYIALSGRYWWSVFILVGVSLFVSETVGCRRSE